MAAATHPAPPSPTKLLTAEEYGVLPDDGRHTELVKGVVIEMPPTNFLHGVACVNIAVVLSEFVRAHRLGRVTGNDSGVITRRDPDSVRGPDVAFFGYARLPADQHPVGYPPVAPDLVFEVRSPSDRWRAIRAKVEEYLTAGVRVVAVLDPEAGALTVFEEDTPPRTLSGGDEFTAPAVLPGFSVPVRRFLE